MPTTYTEAARSADWLKGEQLHPHYFSRENVTILAGSSADRVLTTGMVVAKVTKGAATAVAGGGNTGNGTCGAVTVGAAAKPGVYTVSFFEADSDAGDFQVIDPDGILVGVGRVAAAFSFGGLTFTIADGSTDFAAGDSFTITVAAGSGKVVQIDHAGTTGTEDAYGVLLSDVTAPDGVDAKGVVIVRNAIIDPLRLTWPAGATTNQKNAALAQLAAKGIITAAAE